MKRVNTADDEMIKDFKELKAQGISDFICITSFPNMNKKSLKPVMKHSAQGVSAYANRMYRTYGDIVSVEVGYFDNNIEWHTYTTYGA